ncbi:RasGTPase-activating protein [Heterostelium album PN500]|uniref:RasGTPase-activating protein n=1 Tax=Heterostelium pallidum (strain ATCC 26659 / Pp 5 / PN500) TaxID=670386 RepID=D3BBL5_HETP5|nr:RasGTPase-activating protein [Heterostelium album PN500]EFA81048.1 RasGTPase-activating protein [Heterostelium album PN500]|eukprot:XP_020433166.1 RasGTPase-activating protein [Heterostelium album PN500]
MMMDQLSTTSNAYNAMISAENSVKGTSNTVVIYKPLGVDILPQGSIITEEEQAIRNREKSMTLMYSIKESSIIDQLFKLIALNQIDVFKQLYNYIEQDEYLLLSKVLMTISIGCNSSLRLVRYFIHCDYKQAVAGNQSPTMSSLLNYCREIATQFTSTDSIDKLPVPIKVVAMFYHEMWPHEEDQGISNFLINRFLVQALQSPESYSLVPPQLHISARSSSNLTIIAKMISHTLTGTPFKYGEEKDIEQTKQTIKQIFRESNYFKSVLGSRFSTQSYQFSNEATMSQLHLIHRLLWQNKQEIQSMFKNVEFGTEFDSLINKLGDYNSRISLQSIAPNELKSIKNYMNQKNEDISYIGYIQKNGKRGPVKRVLVVGTNKVITFKHTNGKLGRDGHLLDLVEINSPSGQQLDLIFKRHQISSTSEDCDHIITCIRRIYEYSFNNWPFSMKMKLKITPQSRLEAIAPADHTPSSIMVAAYKSLCAYYQSPVKPNVCWFIENAFGRDPKNKVFNFKLFTKHTREQLSNQDLIPLIHALRYDWYFEELAIKNYPITLKELITEITTMLSSNTTINSISLSNLSLPKESIMQIFDVIQNQKTLNLTKLDISKNMFDEKSVNSFVAYLQYGQTGAIKELNISSIGVTANAIKLIFDALRRGNFQSLESLDFSGNKNLKDNCFDIAKWLSNEGAHVKSLNLSDTELKPKNLIVDFGKSKLETLNLSKNVLKTRDDVVALSQLFNNLTNLQSIILIRTLIPSDSIKEMIRFIDKRKLTQFNIGENQLTRTVITDLISSSAIHSIRVLDLTENKKISDGGIKELGRALYGNQSIVKLVLDGSFSGSAGAQRSKAVLALSNFLQSSHTIEVLKMRGGPDRDQQLQGCIIPLLLSLGSVQSLKKLDISHHMIDNSGAIALSKAIYQNRSIRTLLIDNNNIGALGYANIKNSLKQNYIIKEMPIPISDLSIIYKFDGTSNLEKNKIRSLLFKIESYLLRNQQY